MASKLPYLASPGVIPKILAKIQEARRPDRFTQDFLETKLGHSGGSSRPIIPLLKRLGFISPDGVPTARYDQFRNKFTQRAAMAQGIREAYEELYSRNEYAHDLSRDKLTALVTEITGSTKEDTTTKCIVSSFEALLPFADFDADSAAPSETTKQAEPDTGNGKVAVAGSRQEQFEEIKFAVGYTINLNLPETTDPEVFNAIFKALKANLLSRS